MRTISFVIVTMKQLLPRHTISKVITILLTLAPTTLALAKPFPAGIVDLANGQITPQNTIGNLAKYLWTNQNIDGMRVRTQWVYAQPAQSTYDWTGIDEALRLGTQYGKFVGVSVTAGVDTPQWVYNAGATKYALQDGT